jgi:hypothetical protein
MAPGSVLGPAGAAAGAVEQQQPARQGLHKSGAGKATLNHLMASCHQPARTANTTECVNQLMPAAAACLLSNTCTACCTASLGPMQWPQPGPGTSPRQQCLQEHIPTAQPASSLY